MAGRPSLWVLVHILVIVAIVVVIIVTVNARIIVALSRKRCMVLHNVRFLSITSLLIT